MTVVIVIVVIVTVVIAKVVIVTVVLVAVVIVTVVLVAVVIKSCIGTSEKFRQTQARLNPVGRNSTQFRNSNGGDRSQIRT